VQGRNPLVAVVSDAEEFGGAERYLVMLVESLRDEYDFVGVVGDEAAPETERRLRDAGARISVVPGLRRRPTLHALAGLQRTLGALTPDLVHVNATDQGDSLGPLAIARSFHPPTVLTLHLVIPARKRLRELVSRWACRRADAAIGVSNAVGRYLDDAGAKTTVVANGVAVPSVQAADRRSLDVGDDAFLVGGIGRLHDQKGWDILCDAAALVHDRIPTAEFVVVGTGPELTALQRHGTRSDVRFVGYREDAASLLPLFDVVVVPSRYEGFGLAAAEAMLLGVPVVASRTGGLEEVVGDSGILVPPGDAAALAAAIAELHDDRPRRERLAAGGRGRARTAFTVERMARETRAVYERVMRA
jgi:glycosyltransferase involved in cell wall biosynthesis